MEKAKLFWTGWSQAVRLPKEFWFGEREVRISRRGAAVILEPIPARWNCLDQLGGPVDGNSDNAVVVRPEIGAFKSQRRERNLATVGGLRFEIHPFDHEDAQHAR